MWRNRKLEPGQSQLTRTAFTRRDRQNAGEWPEVRCCLNMWPFSRKRKELKVVLNREHIWRELVPIPRRALTEEEMEWVRQSLRSQKDLADFLIPQLFAVSKCPCGTCRTVGLESLELPNCKGRSGKVGGLGIQTKEHGPIDILLHANHGFLVEMEVIWYNFPRPFPEAWEDVSRMPDPTD